MTASKNTLVLGASEHSTRYSNKAIKMLREHGHSVVAIGARKGKVLDVAIHKDSLHASTLDIHTVTLYLNPDNQKLYYDYILSLHPKRIIFNPGAENRDLYRLAKKKDIMPIEACTLVLLSTGQY